MKTATIAHNATIAKLHAPDRELKLAVQAVLSYAVAGAEHAIAFKKGVWDGRSSFLDFKAGTFPAGFVQYVAAHLRHKGYEVRLARSKLPEPLGPENPVVDAFPEDPRYDYQPETVRRLVKHGQIIAQVATGGGKSRIARLAYKRINRMTLFITTRSLLMYQMKDSFERDLKEPVSVLGDGQFGHTRADGGMGVRKMCVGMVQTLAAKVKEKTVDGEFEAAVTALAAKELKEVNAFEKKVFATPGILPVDAVKQVKAFEARQKAARPDAKRMKADIALKVHEHMAMRARVIALLGQFELVIVEEAHEASAEDFYMVMQHCKKANYRMALTATPFMKADEEANMRLMAVSGPIAIKVSEQMLIDRGILAQPHFRFIPWPAAKLPKLFKHTGWASAYRLGITDHQWRNETIVATCKRFAEYGLTSMVLVQHTAHGDTLKAMLAGAGLRAEFIRGEDDHEARKEALRALARGDIDVLIGTTILDVGVDVPAVGHICLAGGGKAEVQLRQRIGRGLREKKNGAPNVCFVTDFQDGLNEHLHNHAKQRQSIIKGTPGFERFVIENGGDFNLEKLGFQRFAMAAA